MAHVRVPMKRWQAWWKRLDTPANCWALLLCLILILLVIFTSDQSPQWIYQGF
jgi:hypothetical protein